MRSRGTIVLESRRRLVLARRPNFSRSIRKLIEGSGLLLDSFGSNSCTFLSSQENVSGDLFGPVRSCGRAMSCFTPKSLAVPSGPLILPLGLFENDQHIVGIRDGTDVCFALTATPSSKELFACGSNRSGETTLPGGLNNPFAIAASWHYSAALVVGGGASIPSSFLLTNVRWSPSTFSVFLTSQAGVTYVLEYKD